MLPGMHYSIKSVQIVLSYILHRIIRLLRLMSYALLWVSRRTPKRLLSVTVLMLASMKLSEARKLRYLLLIRLDSSTVPVR